MLNLKQKDVNILKKFGIFFLYNKYIKKNEQKYFLIEINFIQSLNRIYFIGKYENENLYLYLNKCNKFTKIGVIENATDYIQIFNGLYFFKKYGISDRHPCFETYIKIPYSLKKEKFDKYFSVKNFKRVLKTEYFKNRNNMIIKKRGTDLVVIKKPSKNDNLDYIMTINLKSLFYDNIPFVKSLVFFNVTDDFKLDLKISTNKIVTEYRNLIKRKKIKGIK
jgi:hypothetical protein